MTEDELELLMSDFPTLYHMAAPGSWPSIKKHGLRSTSSLLDLYKDLNQVEHPRRNEIERCHRPESVDIRLITHPAVVIRIRDQKAMSDGGLRQCLQGNLSPSDWYKILNSMVFFWLSKDRLQGMIGAKGNRYSEHDILEVDTRSLVQAHRAAIRLCPINSGCTNPSSAERCESSFLPIADYPYSCWRKKRRSRKKAVVELTVMRSVPDIRDHVKNVITNKYEPEMNPHVRWPEESTNEGGMQNDLEDTELFEPSEHLTKLYEHLVSTYPLDHEGYHGKYHWRRVLRNARLLADAIPAANPKILELFALIHDSRRENEDEDPEHGWRAADHAATLRGSWFEATDAEMDQLAYACHYHADGLTEADVTVQACWDADRLDLGRVGIRPEPARLCTDFAKRPGVIEEAYRRSRQYR